MGFARWWRIFSSPRLETSGRSPKQSSTLDASFSETRQRSSHLKASVFETSADPLLFDFPQQWSTPVPRAFSSRISHIDFALAFLPSLFSFAPHFSIEYYASAWRIPIFESAASEPYHWPQHKHHRPYAGTAFCEHDTRLQWKPAFTGLWLRKRSKEEDRSRRVRKEKARTEEETGVKEEKRVMSRPKVRSRALPLRRRT